MYKFPTRPRKCQWRESSFIIGFPVSSYIYVGFGLVEQLFIVAKFNWLISVIEPHSKHAKDQQFERHLHPLRREWVLFVVFLILESNKHRGRRLCVDYAASEYIKWDLKVVPWGKQEVGKEVAYA